MSDVAVSAVSPWLFPRWHRPPLQPGVTSAKKLGEALRRLRRRRVAPRRATPSRRNETDARTSSQRSRHNSGVAVVIFPAELTTHEGRTRLGPKIGTSATSAEPPMLFPRRKRPCRRRKYEQQQINWTGRHVGSAASVNFPRDLVTRPEKTPTSSKHSNRAPSRGRGP